MRNKYVAGILAFFIGAFGIHKFYLGKKRAGILYLIFFWTYIPMFLGIIDALILVFMSDENFNKQYNEANTDKA